MQEYDLTNEREEQVKLPPQNYKLRIKEEPEFKVSSNKNDMLVFKAEVIEPEVVMSKGKPVPVAGTEIDFWAVFKDGKNFMLSALHTNANYPQKFVRDDDSGLPIDDNGQPFRYSGIEFYGRCESNESQAKDADGKPLSNPHNGKVVSFVNHRLREIYTP